MLSFLVNWVALMACYWVGVYFGKRFERDKFARGGYIDAAAIRKILER